MRPKNALDVVAVGSPKVGTLVTFVASARTSRN
jgi:hypothetical protein